MANEVLLKNIKLVRAQIEDARKTLLQEKAMGTVKKADDAVAQKELISEAKMLAKAAFSLGPSGEVCSCCGGSGRS